MIEFSDPDMEAHIAGDHDARIIHIGIGEPRVDPPSGWVVKCLCGWSKRRRYKSDAAAELEKHTR